MTEIIIHLQADSEIVKALNELAHSMRLLSASMNAQAAQSAPVAEEEKLANGHPEATMEAVREKLAALVQAGKQNEVKKLINSFGAKKPTEVPPAAEEEKPANGRPEVTLEAVREKLAALSQAGRQAEVKKLINSFGAKKLTEVPPDKYPELLAAAEVIGG